MLKKLIVNKKSKAQALVEFAIILTLLLTLVYGILEAGRLMFIYGSTVTAAREATRYGSATGKNPTGIPYYKDCANIRAAASRIGFINIFTDTVISYDHGPNTGDFLTCESLVALEGAATDSCLSGALRTGDRVKMCVSTTWNPIVGGLVPLRWNRTEKNCLGQTVTRANFIQKSSERTILCGVSIGVTPVATWVGTGGLSLTCGASTSPAPYTQVGQVIKYTYLMTNTGSSDLTGAFTIAADRGSATCGAGYTIYPGKNYTCTGNYTITQADLDAGSVVNTATAYTSGASSLPCSNTVNSSQVKKLTLTISATDLDDNVINTALLDTVVKFTYKITNTGNVTLTSPSYTLTDTVPPPSASAVTCPTPATLVPGGVITCSENYTIRASDVTATKLVNTATLAYTPPSAATQTTTAVSTIFTSKLILTVTASVSPLTDGQVPPSATIAGQVITYNYVIYNNSGIATTAVAPTIAITNASFIPFTVTCPAVSIPNKGYMTCAPATYTVTQSNIDAGAVKPLIHTATATANNGSVITSGAMPVSVPVAPNDELTLTISATTNPITPPPGIPTVTAVGNTFVFNYTLTNTGNTTLIAPFSITAPGATTPSTIRGGATSLTVTCISSSEGLLPAYINPSGVLIPGESTTCSSAPITVTASDLNYTYGSYYITNPATANAMTKVVTGGRASTKVSSEPQTGLIATAIARLNVGITANLVGMQIQYTYTMRNTGNSEISLTASYPISTYTLSGANKITPPANTSLVSSAAFICATTPITIAIDSLFTCPIVFTYPITIAQYNAYSSITNTIDTATPTNPLVTSIPVTTPLTSACNVSGVGTGTGGRIPDATVADANGVYKTTWKITNSIPATTVYINSIILTWATLDTEVTNVSLTGVSPTLVWSGKTKGSDGFFPISSDTNSATAKPPWPLAFVNNGTYQTMTLTFTKPTVQIRVQLGFSDPASCYASGGLDSGAWP